MESEVLLINCLPLTHNLSLLKLHCNVASFCIFYCYIHSGCFSNLVYAFPPPAASLLLSTFYRNSSLCNPDPLCKSYPTRIFITSFFLLINSGTGFLFLYFLLPMTLTLAKEEYHNASLLAVDHSFWTLDCSGALSSLGLCDFFFPFWCFLFCKKKSILYTYPFYTVFSPFSLHLPATLLICTPPTSFLYQ